MARTCRVDTSVGRRKDVNGQVSWYATSEGFDDDYCIESSVQPIEQIATVNGLPVDIGEPWPDPETPEGLASLLAIAERLAVDEWKRRYGADK